MAFSIRTLNPFRYLYRKAKETYDVLEAEESPPLQDDLIERVEPEVPENKLGINVELLDPPPQTN